MAERLSELEQSREIRAVLHRVLQVLDEAELHMPAIYIAMALTELGKEKTFGRGVSVEI